MLAVLYLRNFVILQLKLVCDAAEHGHVANEAQALYFLIRFIQIVYGVALFGVVLQLLYVRGDKFIAFAE